MCLLFTMAVAVVVAQDAPVDPAATEYVVPADDGPTGILPFLSANWAELLIALMAFAKVVVRLTPTIKDDKVFGWLDDLIAFFVPNLRNTTKT